MCSKAYARDMARYNHWQKTSLVAAATRCGEAERQRDRGAFFGSIHKTFSHLFWADQIWLSRFAGTQAPPGGIAASLELIRDWNDFVGERQALDHRILDWAQTVSLQWFEGDMSWYSGAMGKNMQKPKALLVAHFFNHQTHHRGQIHAMLTAVGEKPDTTDLAFMPEAFAAL